MRNGNKTLRGSILFLLLATSLASGCMRRRMTIRSDPPGAVVIVDGYELGTTPLTRDFTFYGDRSIRLIKDGYETLEVMQPVYGPWYQTPPLDFVTDNLWPAQIQDHHAFDYVLTPRRVESPGELRRRAEIMRRGTHLAAGLPPATVRAAGVVVGPTTQTGPTSAAGPTQFAVPTLASPRNVTPQPGVSPQPGIIPIPRQPSPYQPQVPTSPPRQITPPMTSPIQPPMNQPTGGASSRALVPVPAIGGTVVQPLPSRL